MKWAVANVNKYGGAYDFLQLLQSAHHRGCKAIWFVHRELDDYKEQKRKLHRISVPICELTGFKYEIADKEPEGLDIGWPDEEQKTSHVKPHSLFWLKRVTKPLPVMPTEKALEWARKELAGRELVVFIRQAPYQDKRNSSEDWRRWAKDHDAYVLEDSCITDLDVDERAAIHELAKMSLGTACGQSTLVTLTEHRPYLLLKTLVKDYRPLSEDWWNKHGWKAGEQFPWASKKQKLVWNYEDDYETIEREYRILLHEAGAA